MSDGEFDRTTEVLAERLLENGHALKALIDGSKNAPGETLRYLSLARTAAQEAELWLGKAMVAYVSGNRQF